MKKYIIIILKLIGTLSYCQNPGVENSNQYSKYSNVVCFNLNTETVIEKDLKNFLENFFIEPVEENDQFISINYSKIYKFLINESLTEYDLPLENIYKKLDTILNDQITKKIFEEFGNVNKKQYIKFRLLKQNKEIIDTVKIIINILLQEHHRQMDLSSGFKKYFYKNIRIFFNDINIHKRREIKALQESQQKQLKNEILVSFLRKTYVNPPINYYEKNSFLKFSKYYLERENMTFFYFSHLPCKK
jgi:hypothetical protein